MQETGNDYLTGLYTRQKLYAFYAQLGQEVPLHFMFMDVDNFKNVNDVYGHNAGDELLKAVASILTSSAPLAKAIRLGGDEFVLLFTGAVPIEELSGIAQNIISRVTDHEGFSQISTIVSASIGILYNETSVTPLDAVLSKSDVAMYYAKNHGKGRFVFYHDIEESILIEKELEKRQHIALEQGEFEIRYLPVISPQTSRLVLSQAKLFWNLPDGTTKERKDFITLFERNGFICILNRWMIREVCRHLELYHQNYQQAGKIGIYISKLLLLEKDFVPRLLAYIAQHGISPSELELELSEPSFVRGSTQVIHALKELKKSGFAISVIDVGTDFKSLKYWDTLFLDSIIFDSGYLNRTLRTSRGRQIIKMLLGTGRELKMAVMANGVASREEADFLSRCGCSAIAGPCYSGPLERKQYFDYVKDRLLVDEVAYEFRFRNHLRSEDGQFEGIVIGSGIEYKKGITDNWNALSFPGGSSGQNLIELPMQLLSEPSFTVCMWLKPLVLNCWTSTFYARYRGCFTTFSPSAAENNSIFRVRDDADSNGWYDVLFRQIPCNEWSFVCLTYDDASSTTRAYINGRKAGFLANIPSLMACRQILIGGDPFQDSYTGYLSGLIFYNYVKSESELEALYEQFFSEPGFAGKKENFWLEND